MPLRTEDWLDGVACRSARPEESGGQIRLRDLRGDQKRDLAQFGLAAVASCAFFMTPLLLAGGARVLPSTALDIQFAMAPAAITGAGAAVGAPDPEVRRPRARRVGTRAVRTLPAQGAIRGTRSEPPLILATAVHANPLHQPAAIPAVQKDTGARPRPKTRHAVSRVIFGDGRYRVRPFPIPADED